MGTILHFLFVAKYQTTEHIREVIQPQGQLKVYVTLANLYAKIDVFILKL